MAQIRIFDIETYEPVPFSTVAELSPGMVPTGRGVAADASGIANFVGSDFEDSFLRVSSVGYQPQTFVYDSGGGGNDAVTNVYLYPYLVTIDQAEVVTKKDSSIWAILLTVVGVALNYRLRA